jgi:rSAM/selenodomain-associated transferase 1
MKQVLVVMAKQPAAGKTKTRLQPALSNREPALLYEAFLQDMLEIIRAVPAVARFINFWPPEAVAYFEQLAPDFNLTVQEGESLGARLDNVSTNLLINGFDQVVITNSDSPTLPVEYLTQAFTALNSAEVVLGPCDDGGYYLIGLTRPQPRLLREVTMSTPTVLDDTLALAEAEGLTVNLTPAWYDVDTIQELNRLRTELAQAPKRVASHTRYMLAQLKRQ